MPIKICDVNPKSKNKISKVDIEKAYSNSLNRALFPEINNTKKEKEKLMIFNYIKYNKT